MISLRLGVAFANKVLKGRGFFLQQSDLPRLRLEEAVEVRSPEAFCGSCPLVPECPSVPFKALERMFNAAL